MNEQFLNDKSPYYGREEAIKNLGGMVSLYEKHLAKFKLAYADSTEKISTLLEQEDFETARILAHSIKGLSGTLGLTRLYHAASDLETAIKSMNVPIEALLFNYDSCLREIISDTHKE